MTRGRPAGSRNATRKQQIALRVDADVLAYYRSTGPGWQTRMNEALAQSLIEEQVLAARHRDPDALVGASSLEDLARRLGLT